MTNQDEKLARIAESLETRAAHFRQESIDTAEGTVASKVNAAIAAALVEVSEAIAMEIGPDAVTLSVDNLEVPDSKTAGEQ